MIEMHVTIYYNIRLSVQDLMVKVKANKELVEIVLLKMKKFSFSLLYSTNWNGESKGRRKRVKEVGLHYRRQRNYKNVLCLCVLGFIFRFIC